MRALTYRISLVLAGLIWTCIATTLCGCSQTSGYVNNRAGQAFYEQGNYTAARHAFQRALVDNPHNADYAFNVAASMRKQGDVLGAERMFKSALRKEPSHQPAHHGYADMLREQGRMDEAQHLLTSWNSSQPYDAESYVEMAWMQQKDGDLSGAESSLRKALRINPSHPQALAHLGHIYQRSGRHQEATALYRRSLQGNPNQSEVHSNLAQMTHPSSSGGTQMAGPMPQFDPSMTASGSMPMMSSMPADQMSGQAAMMNGQPTITYGEPFIVDGPPEMMNGQMMNNHPSMAYGGTLTSPTQAGTSSSVPPMVMLPETHSPSPHSYGAPAMLPRTTSQPTYMPPTYAPGPASGIQQVQYETSGMPSDPAHAPMVGSMTPTISAF